MATKTAPKKSAAPELSRSALVERALLLADDESLDAVTIRRLATEFGVTPMALYWHFKNKDELLAAMGDSYYEGIDVSGLADDTQPWAERLQSVLDRLVRALRLHPGSAALAMPRILQSPSGLRFTELSLQLLRDAGFDLQESADIARTALQTALMLVSNMPGGEFGVAAEQRSQVLDQKRAAIAQLPATEFPRIRESVDALTSCDDVDAYFGYGADLFVAGVIARHDRLARSAR